ncbi:MAG: alginate export family protein [Bacteroidota bacterium]
MACFVEPAGAQFILSGDIDGRLSNMNLHRTISDSLNSKTLNFSGFGELDLKYVHRKWNAYASLFVTYTKGSTLSMIRPPGEINFGFYEAWFRYYFSKYFSIQAGRIEISYDDQRFFAARDFNGLVTSHNAIIAHYLDPDTSLIADLGFAANKFDPGAGIFSTNRSVNSYRYMSYLYAYKRLFDEQLALTFTNIFNAEDNGYDKTLLYGRNTLGGSGWLSLDDWDFNLAGFYQFGHVNDGRLLSAWYAALYVSYRATPWLNLMPAFEHMSGDNYSDSAENKWMVHGFSMLYGNMTRSFGNGSVLTNAYRMNLHPGLNNLYFVATFDITHNFCVEAAYHWFSLAHPYIHEFNPDSFRIEVVKVPKSFLHQAEITFTYSPVHTLELTLDYQLLFPGAAMTNFNGWNFKPGIPISAAYIEMEWTPVFFPRKKKHSLKPYAPVHEPLEK